MSELPALDAMDNPTVQGRRPGALEWVALFALVVHGTQAAYNILRGPKGSATMYVSLADVLLGVAFLLWILRRIARRDFSWPPITVPLLAAAWMALSLGALLWRTKGVGLPCGNAAKSGLKEILQFCEYFLVAYLVLAEAFRSERVRRWAVPLLAVSAVVAVGAALTQYFSSGPVMAVVGPKFVDRHTFGMFLALALPLICGVAIFSYSWWKRALVALLILASLCVMLAGGPFLALCAGLLVVAGLRGRAWVLVVAVALLLLCTQVLPHLPRGNSDVLLDSVALYRTGDPYGIFNEVIPDAQRRLGMKRAALNGKIMSQRPIDSPAEIPTEADYAWKWSQRYQEWQAALNMMSQHPWLGVGTGSYQKEVGPYYGDMPKYAKNLMEPDALSFYMVWGASVGVPFLLLFGWMLLRAGGSAAQACLGERSPFDRGLAAGVIGSLVAFLIGGVFTDPLVRGVGMTTALVLALALTLAPKPGAPEKRE